MAETVKLEDGVLPAAALARVAQAAQACKVIAFPTDSGYFLGSTALVKAASRRIHQVLGRADLKPLTVLVAAAEDAKRWVEWTPQAEALARRFWPGPLTLLLKPTAEGRLLTFAEFATVAVRVPGGAPLREAMALSGVPWAAAPTPEASGPAAYGDQVDLVVDGGTVAAQEPTIVDASGPRARLTREGAIPAAAVMAALEEEP